MKQTIANEDVYLKRFSDLRDQLGPYVDGILLDELIPPWCTGIDPDFWKTDLGRQISLLLWGVHYTDICSIKEAGEILYGHKPDAAERRWLREVLTVYPYPLGIQTIPGKSRISQYVLRSDALRLKESGQYRRRRSQKNPKNRAGR
jgi:hypothetical protein